MVLTVQKQIIKIDIIYPNETVPEHVINWFANELQNEFAKRSIDRFSILCLPVFQFLIFHIRDKACSNERLYELCFIDSCVDVKIIILFLDMAYQYLVHLYLWKIIGSFRYESELPLFNIWKNMTNCLNGLFTSSSAMRALKCHSIII